MLKITDLEAKFESTSILRNISLEIKPGETHVILGPNGAGKSTLGRILLGDPQYEISNGSITFFDQDFLDLKTHERARLGFFLSFQSPPEIEGVSANELLFSAKKSLDPDFVSSFRFQKSLAENLKKVHLPENFSERAMHRGASGGERKKMEVASMLALDPKLVFLDEIDSGIDIDGMKSIGSALRDFLGNPEKSAIIVSHTEKFLQEIFENESAQNLHVHVLCGGTIVRSGDGKLIAEVHRDGYCPFLKKDEKTCPLKILNNFSDQKK
ncbi:Fe-S cluster assembly ATPase SufC [bacterium]|jgi:Fe-S cluster assembly ATP-binding protein|nr:Fe-S cluster assembly ATPase SufC [bacterium]MBT6831648.1 Fe-S cluster assembly ATPase SufC [bacterium]MBT6996294.1 Fe-S cluster assembly ATPase SufC [bacterium]MBT7772972.1 Fe-S cluster assembly ATPase SufC [bacterium]